jgi:hypothetical protein
MNAPQNPACQRVILLGASNLTRGISTVVETARSICGGPLDVLAAFGHGRSYGMDSRVLGRRLPGILHCGLWEAPGPAFGSKTPLALITDIGNDIMYGASPAEIARWIERCLDRLAQQQARVVMTPLPMASLQRMTPGQFRIVRALLFPSREITHADAMARSRELNERLHELAAARGVMLVPHRLDWYGFDPIHIRLRRWREAWGSILAAWQGDRPAAPSPALAQVRGSLARWAYLRAVPPQERWILGWRQRRRQPAGRLRDGTNIWWY